MAPQRLAILSPVEHLGLRPGGQQTYDDVVIRKACQLTVNKSSIAVYVKCLPKLAKVSHRGPLQTKKKERKKKQAKLSEVSAQFIFFSLSLESLEKLWTIIESKAHKTCRSSKTRSGRDHSSSCFWSYPAVSSSILGYKVWENLL